MWLVTGNADPCPGNWQHETTETNPKPSVNTGPSWDFAIIIPDMYECMRISRGLSTRWYGWASSMVAREARKNWHGQRRRKKRSTS